MSSNGLMYGNRTITSSIQPFDNPVDFTINIFVNQNIDTIGSLGKDTMVTVAIPLLGNTVTTFNEVFEFPAGSLPLADDTAIFSFFVMQNGSPVDATCWVSGDGSMILAVAQGYPYTAFTSGVPISFGSFVIQYPGR